MHGSYNHLLHIIGFGLLSASFLGSFLLDRRLRAEKEITLKLYIAAMMRKLGLTTPFIALILLVTGIGNIHNRLAGVPMSWYEEGWLVAKIIFFVVMLFNGTILGPKLSRKRAGLLKAMSEGDPSDEGTKSLAGLNRQISLFYLVQTILLLVILFLSTFGPGKHPGAF